MEPDYAAQRKEMVDRQLKARGIRDPRVLAAMLEIPREEFLPPHLRHMAYIDDPVPIGFGQTISQPYITALMVECLELTGEEIVLDVGAGSGYHAAVLGAIARWVYSIEIIPELAEQARKNLARVGREANITVICGDGSAGYPERAPYDAISVAAAAPEVPPKLLDQLNDPGRLVIPVGSLWDQELRLVTKREGKIESRLVTYCRFVPLRGGNGWAFPD
ncbi:MAG: protein-L-isoaspartate(D-aspartate) O-methyltransferase [Bryobacterales bacterium]|nr:protein-L-isoaspartate(D-aspartate) O-methyltransferase [Bryobacteraceae bacterium]MDW8352930.1 protein-L-isoaspartate(D-aspartate) O-methyltransferase [Bryobacterales bacterium]